MNPYTPNGLRIALVVMAALFSAASEAADDSNDPQAQARMIIQGDSTHDQSVIVSQTNSAAVDSKVDAQESARRLLSGKPNPAMGSAAGAPRMTAMPPLQHQEEKRIDAVEQARRLLLGKPA